MHRTRCGEVVSAFVLVATLACAARMSAAGEARPTSTRAQLTNSKVLGRAELRRSAGSNALEIVQELRPLFLQSRGHTSVVFVDFVRRGGTETLREIDASDIAEIRYLDSGEATQLFGSGVTGGIIHVLTKKRP